jgi:aspartyl protease
VRRPEHSHVDDPRHPDPRRPAGDLRGNLIYFRGRINDSDSLWMVLDSGASANAIDVGVARTLGLTIAEGGVAHGAGGTVEQGTVRDVTVQLPGATLSGTWLGAIPLDGFRVQTGRAMDVILGRPLLSRSVVRIDYAARTLEILPADGFRYSGRGAVIPITWGCPTSRPASPSRVAPRSRGDS